VQVDVEHVLTVIEALQPPTVFVDHDNRITISNRPARDMLGGALAGRHYFSVLRQPVILDAIDSVLRGGDSAAAPFITGQDAGETIWQASARALIVAGQRGALVSFEDTTATEEAGQMRRDFVANVSHELRTPLTALIGFIETLGGAARNDPAARDRFLSIMAREANRMNRLVQDLLSLSRVESEERLRPTVRLNPGDLLRSVTVSLGPLLEAQNVTINLEGCADLPDLPGDGDQLRQVFTNLIENAAKYGGFGGTVTITATQIDHEPSMRGPALRIDVRDSGEGIDPIHLPRLTERFYRVDAHRSQDMGGTGLGLAIVKHIINRHRGRLKIESEPGQGSTFSVFLPLG